MSPPTRDRIARAIAEAAFGRGTLPDHRDELRADAVLALLAEHPEPATDDAEKLGRMVDAAQNECSRLLAAGVDRAAYAAALIAEKMAEAAVRGE